MLRSIFTTTILSILISATSLFGQANTVTIGQVSHEDALQACVAARLEPDVKTVEKAWSSYLKKNYGIKLKGKRPAAAVEVDFGAISAQTMDFFTEFSEADGGTEMRVFARLGYDDYISNADHPNMYAAMKDVTTQFVKGFLQAYYSEMIDEESKELEKMQKIRTKYKEGVADLEKDNTGHAEDIAKLEEKIQKNENEVETLTDKISTSDETIKSRESKVNALRAKYNAIPGSK